jgi:hypothetical protein
MSNTGERLRIGSICPCWRDGSPYAFEILRKDQPRRGSYASLRCRVTPEKWGSPGFAAIPQCK